MPDTPGPQPAGPQPAGPQAAGSGAAGSEAAGLLEVGRIGRAHGVKGAVYVSLTSDRDERLVIGAELFDGRAWLRVVSSRPQPQRKWVVHFDGIADRNAAELLTGRQLFAAPVADDDALWVHELIGARVIDAAGIDHGVCVSVVDNPAHDILELDSGHLVPVTFVVSLADGVITVAAPDGLFDLLD